MTEREKSILRLRSLASGAEGKVSASRLAEMVLDHIEKFGQEPSGVWARHTARTPDENRLLGANVCGVNGYFTLYQHQHLNTWGMNLYPEP